MGRAAPASELPVAEGAPQETWEEQWVKTAEMQRQDEEARAEFKHQRNLVEAHRRGEAAVAALEEQAQARRQELARAAAPAGSLLVMRQHPWSSWR